ncbi:MAG: DUF4435 domain-containing protein [Chryseobacterium sp.]|nr:MAG: DUF4435 domain-containing protein [Chryseobacterium sp.]
MIINVSNNGKVLKDSPKISTPDFVVITGENGSGKTQLLETIAHLPEFNTLTDDDGTPFGSVQFMKLGFDLESGIPLDIENIVRQDYQKLRVVRASLFLIKGLSFETPEAEALFLYKQNVDFLASHLGGSRPAGHSILPISPATIQEVKDLSTFFDKDSRELTEIDMLISLKHTQSAFSPELALIFHQYELMKKYYPEKAKAIVSPIDTFNGILDEMDIPYSANYTLSENELTLNKIKFKNKSSQAEIYETDFSSGEKTIISLMFSLYGVRLSTEFPQVVLFDEPDSHLHPSMTKKFLDVIMNTFIGKNKIKVIITTHSPTTIALVEPDNIFVINNGVFNKTTKSDAIDSLTNGLVVVTDSTKYVIVEDTDDRDFYTLIFNELKRQKYLAPEISFVFIPASTATKSGGKGPVRNWVEKQKELGLPSLVLGLIDEDYGNHAKDGVYVLERYSIENFLIDPINIYAALMDKEKNEKVGDLNLHIGEEYKLQDLRQDDLQQVADSILRKISPLVESKFADFDATTEKDFVEVKLSNSITLNYPKWLVQRRGKTLLNELIMPLFGNKNVHFGALIKSMRKTNLYPLELAAKFEEMHQTM